MRKFTFIFKKRFLPFFLIAYIFVFTMFHDYIQASSLVIPDSGAWSAYDVLYTLLQSIGISISLNPTDDDVPKGFTKDTYDEYVDYILEWSNTAQQNIDTGDTPLQKFVDEIKALPENIHDGCISISQDLWNFLNNYGYEATDARINVDTAVVAGSDIPFIYSASCFNPNLVLDFYLSTNEVCFVYTKVYQNGKYYYSQFAVSDTSFIYSFTNSNVSDPSFSRYNSASYNGYYYAKLGAGLFSDAYLIGYEISSIPDFINSLSGDLAINAPDVIWPKTDLAYDIVNHVATWDDAIANDLITTAEDDDTVAVIPLTDTGVGDDVYTNVGVTDIPSTGEDVKDSEATDEDAKEETVDQSVIATLPDSASKAGDITKYFPFCIPFDLVSMIKGMQAEQKPPVWNFKFYFKTIDYTFEVTVDMSDYEKYIKIFRAGLVIFYVIILMLITIRYSSGIVKD